MPGLLTWQEKLDLPTINGMAPNGIPDINI